MSHEESEALRALELIETEEAEPGFLLSEPSVSELELGLLRARLLDGNRTGRQADSLRARMEEARRQNRERYRKGFGKRRGPILVKGS